MNNVLNMIGLSKLEPKDSEQSAQLKTLARDTYRLWLRAGTPPFHEFYRLSLEEQTQLSEAGDAHRVAEQTRLAVFIVNEIEAKLASMAAHAGGPVEEGVEEALDDALEKVG